MGQTMLAVGTLIVEVTIEMEIDLSKTKNARSISTDPN